ncbi:MAG: hypothetical protein ACC631_01330 [Halocynthiibacter sp.]
MADGSTLIVVSVQTLFARLGGELRMLTQIARDIENGGLAAANPDEANHTKSPSIQQFDLLVQSLAALSEFLALPPNSVMPDDLMVEISEQLSSIKIRLMRDRLAGIRASGADNHSNNGTLALF